jgi:hypothetical protein
MSRVIRELNMEGLACLPINGRLSTRSLGVVFRNTTELSAVANIFISMLRVNAANGGCDIKERRHGSGS